MLVNAIDRQSTQSEVFTNTSHEVCISETMADAPSTT
jgi:hypothetical protein